MGQQAKNKSMVLQKQEDELKSRVLRLAKRNYMSLGTFIRLIDYMVVETQVKINQISAEFIYQEMQNENKKYSIIAQVNFDAAEVGMSFTPSKMEVIGYFDKILTEMQQAIAEVPPVIQHSNFIPFVQGLASDTPNFKMIVRDSTDYTTTHSVIKQRFSEDFDYLMNFVKKFELCREVNDFDQNFDFEDFKKDHNDIESIGAYLTKLNNWDKSVSENIKPTESKGLITANGKRIKDLLQKRVKQEQTNMKKYLVELAEGKVTEMNSAIREIKRTLDKQNTNLQQYVEYWSNLKACKDKKLECHTKLKLLGDMVQLLKKNRSKDESHGISF